MSKKKTQIVIADDHQVVRSGIKLLLELETDFEVVSDCGSADEAWRAALRDKPDVLLLDLHMPGENPIEKIPQIVERFPSMAILVLTMQDDPSYVEEALKSGAKGYILKEAADVDLIKAIQTVTEGKRYVDPTIAALLVDRKNNEPTKAADLSKREIEVLQYLVKGFTNKEIADELFLSVRTVETHRAHIIQKTGLNTRAALVRFADEHEIDAD